MLNLGIRQTYFYPALYFILFFKYYFIIYIPTPLLPYPSTSLLPSETLLYCYSFHYSLPSSQTSLSILPSLHPYPPISQIWKRCSEVRLQINNKINSLWTQNFIVTKSGKGNNKNAVLEGIRNLTWGLECHERANQNCLVTLSRARSSKKAVTVEYDQLYQNQYAKIFRKEVSNLWYPTFWLSFLLIGLPADKEGRTVLGAGPESQTQHTSGHLITPDLLSLLNSTSKSLLFIFILRI